MATRKPRSNGSNGNGRNNGRSHPGTRENPIRFFGVAACRSELLSNCIYNSGVHVYVGKGVYLLTGGPTECSGIYSFSYPAKPVGSR